jgi:PKD repeat protein
MLNPDRRLLMVTAWCSTAAFLPCVHAQSRPFLFGMGRYTSSWAGRPWSYDDQCWDHMQNIGVTISGGGLAWVNGEPSPGYYDPDAFAYADHEIDGALARGLEPTFFLGLTPAWAALYPELPSHRTPPREDPDVIAHFMDFHRYVADYFKDRVQYYYFWNEPNGCSWINDGCANGGSYPLYTRWLIRCSQAVKEMDPDAKIIAGRLDYHAGVTNGWQYVQGMYDNGAGPWIDGIAIHPYDWTGTLHWQAILDTRSVMVANGDADKPIWIAEYGWQTTDYQSTANKLVQVLTELKKPEWSYVQMANYLVLNDGGGVENYGLMSADLAPRAGYYVFRDFDKSWPFAADFTCDTPTGRRPLSVRFQDLTQGNTGLTTWSWTFGDGGASDEQNPTHTYMDCGSFTVSLTVTDETGSSTETRADYITAQPSPGDMDCDGDVDQADFGRFQACLTRPGIAQTAPECASARLDMDYDVDADDFSIFQGCTSGANVPADDLCAGP